MNPPKCSEYDYIDFVIATPSVYSCTEAARVQPSADNPPAHDSLNRLLYRLTADAQALWTEAPPAVKWATSNLSMNDLYRLKYAEVSWSIEVYHQGIKQFVGVERCFARKAVAQRNHIGLALRAFLRLERYCFSNGISWFEAKTNIIRQAVRAYLAESIYNL